MMQFFCRNKIQKFSSNSFKKIPTTKGSFISVSSPGYEKKTLNPSFIKLEGCKKQNKK